MSARSNMDSLCLCLAVVALFTSGCVTRQYGLLLDGNEALISVPSGSTIHICGGNPDDMNWALNEWGSAIGRHYDTVADCDQYAIIIHPPESAFAQKRCRQNDQVMHFANSFHLGKGDIAGIRAAQRRLSTTYSRDGRFTFRVMLR